jgi:hypothetical protein
MKLLAALTGLLLGITLLPVALASGDDPPAPACGLHGGDLDTILDTIRHLESGGDYTARARGSSASGAYQFIDSTWNRYGGYQSAWQAPPHVQDAAATEHATAILTRHHGDITAIPVVWYLGHLPNPSSPTWDTIPSPSAGNVLTPREYQQRWLSTYQRLSTGTPDSEEDEAGDSTVCTPTSTGEIVAEGWALPGPRDLLDATTDQLDDPHHTYPAWDWIIPTGTPIYAIRGGTVTRTITWNRNWWEHGCGTHGAGDCNTCGIGVTITDPDHTRWTYCHGSALHVATGQDVTAGQQLITSGNTGRSGTPHLHLEINANGHRRCPAPLLTALHAGRVPPSPGELPVSGCSFPAQ